MIVNLTFFLPQVLPLDPYVHQFPRSWSNGVKSKSASNYVLIVLQGNKAKIHHPVVRLL